MTGPRPNVSLVVDMDGTFFLTDSTALMRRRLRRRPHRLVGLSRRRRAGDKAAVKLYLHRFGAVAPERFTPAPEVHAWLREQAAAGRRIVLATGAPQALADEVRAAYPLIAEAFGTTPALNLTGPRKAAFLVERFGERGFDYAGDSPADLPVWRVCRRAIVCNAPEGLAVAVAGVAELERVLPPRYRDPA